VPSVILGKSQGDNILTPKKGSVALFYDDVIGVFRYRSDDGILHDLYENVGNNQSFNDNQDIAWTVSLVSSVFQITADIKINPSGSNILTHSSSGLLVDSSLVSRNLTFTPSTRELSISGGNTVTIPYYDNQTLSFNTGTRELTISGTGGNTVTIPYYTPVVNNGLSYDSLTGYISLGGTLVDDTSIDGAYDLVFDNKNINLIASEVASIDAVNQVSVNSNSSIIASIGNVTKFEILSSGDIKISNYPNTRSDGAVMKALYVDSSGNIKYGNIDAYSKTELQTSGQASVHWDNITNVPPFAQGIDDLSDVVITSPTDGQLLSYDGGASKWINWTPDFVYQNQSITTSTLTMSTARILGRTSASSGAIEEISISTSTGIVLSSGALSLSSIPNSSLANSTISGISLGSNLGTLTISSPLTGTSYNGSTGVSIGLAGLTGLGTANQFLGMDSGGTAYEYKTFAVGTSGTDFAIAHSTNTITFNLPTGSATNRGAISSTDWSTFNAKIGGSGTINKHAKFTASGTVGDAMISDDGTYIYVNATSGNTYKFQVYGSTWISPVASTSQGLLISDNGTLGLTSYGSNDMEIANANAIYLSSLTTRILTVNTSTKKLTFAGGTGEDTITISNGTDSNKVYLGFALGSQLDNSGGVIGFGTSFTSTMGYIQAIPSASSLYSTYSSRHGLVFGNINYIKTGASSDKGFSFVGTVPDGGTSVFGFAITNNAQLQHTSGTVNYVHISKQVDSFNTFNPTSGTGAMNYLYVDGVINQTGTASGNIRGILVDQTLTAVLGSYRAVEMTNNSGWGIYQSGASAYNHLNGNTIFGGTTQAGYKVDVQGTLRVTGNTTLATIASGTWNGSVITGTYGGTGVNNGSSTLTYDGNVTFSGAFTTTFTVSANTSVTLPTTGTLINQTGSTTTGRVARFSASGTVATGILRDDGSNASLGTSINSSYIWNVNGAQSWNGNITYNSGMIKFVNGTSAGFGGAGAYRISGSSSTGECKHVIPVGGYYYTWNIENNSSTAITFVQGELISGSPGSESAKWQFINGCRVLIGSTTSNGYRFEVNGTSYFYGGDMQLSSSQKLILDTLGVNSYISGGSGAITIYGYNGISATSGGNITIASFNTLRLGAAGNDNYLSGALAIGTGSSPAASAILELVSTTKGFIKPKMTGAQAEAISSPAEGLEVYITNGNGSTITTTGTWFYDGGTWKKNRGTGTVEVTGTTQSLAVNVTYVMNNASLVTGTLPTTAAIGDYVIIVGKGAGQWKVAQNSGQTIHGATDSTTGTGGYIQAGARYDCVKLTCITANTDWVIENHTGTLTIA